MKKLLLVLLIQLSAFTAIAQERTLISGHVEHGGFGGPVVKFTQINQNFGVLVGGRGGWIINHTFVIGGGVYGLVNQIESSRLDTVIAFGYGGGELEWIIRSNYLLHASLQAFAGAGGISLVKDQLSGSDTGNHNGDGVFVGELNLNLEANVTTWFRVGVGGGYRLVSGMNTTGFSDSDFSGPQGMIALKFGKF